MYIQNYAYTENQVFSLFSLNNRFYYHIIKYSHKTLIFNELHSIIQCECIIIYLTKLSLFNFLVVPNILPKYNTVIYNENPCAKFWYAFV